MEKYIMINKEKIKEIIDETLPNYCPSGYSVMMKRSEMEHMLKNMAEWKDKQFVKIIANLSVKIQDLESQVKSLLP